VFGGDVCVVRDWECFCCFDWVLDVVVVWNWFVGWDDVVLVGGFLCFFVGKEFCFVEGECGDGIGCGDVLDVVEVFGCSKGCCGGCVGGCFRGLCWFWRCCFGFGYDDLFYWNVEFVL